MDLFSGLNPQQKLAVECVSGRVLVLAGAGSGKTRVLTLRMAYLIKHLNVSPRSILGLTFTNKAASEMNHRLAGLVDSASAKQVTLSTFHSFCMQVLRNEIERLGYTSQFTLYDEKDVQRLLNMIARDLLDREGELPSLAPTTETITYAKNRGLKAEEIEGTGSDWHDDFTRNLYKRLQDSMRAYNAVDFDSLLCLTVELFENHPDVLERYQERFRYIMIDEYQDTNPIQYRLAALLSAKYNNLCVVGDDDQSIYGWRGADIQNILDFQNAHVIKLEQNYRSTNTILKAANAVIANNHKRHGKALWSIKGEGNCIEVFHAPTETDEAQAIICRMDKLRQNQGLKWGDMAILYRSNALAQVLELELIKHSWKEGDHWVRGVPYQVFGGTEFYERREIKDLMAYLRVVVNPLDEEALLRIVNFPRRGIGEASLDVITAYNRSQQMPLWTVLQGINNGDSQYAALIEKISSKALTGIQAFLATLTTVKQKFHTGALNLEIAVQEDKLTGSNYSSKDCVNLSSSNAASSLNTALEWLISDIDYQKAICEEVKSTQMRDFKWQNVQEFVKTLADYEIKSQSPSLHDFVLSMPLSRGFENHAKSKDENLVTLMTFHSAKGLEFPACFLMGMEDHIIPHEKSLKQTGIEEERRLMYVAITRAMHHLTISMATKRKRMGVDAVSQPSRFLFEIPKEFLKMTHWHEF